MDLFQKQKQRKISISLQENGQIASHLNPRERWRAKDVTPPTPFCIWFSILCFAGSSLP